MKYKKKHESQNYSSVSANIVTASDSFGINGVTFLKFFLLVSFPVSFLQLAFGEINETTILVFFLGSALHGAILYSISGSKLSRSYPQFGKRTQFFARIGVGFCLAYTSYWAWNFGPPATLNGLQNRELPLGVLVFMSSSVLQTFGILIFLVDRSMYIKILSLAAIVVTSVIFSYLTLSKIQLLSSFTMLIMILKNKRFRSWYAIPSFLLLIFSLFFVYRGRESVDITVNYAYVIEKVFLRWPLIVEPSLALEFVAQNGSLWDIKLSNFVTASTTAVFGRLDAIGIAPGLLGFLILKFGLWALPVAIVGISICLRIFFLIPFFKNANEITLFLWYTLFFNLLHFFVDGNPTFITGTTGYILFYLQAAGLGLSLLLPTKSKDKEI